MSKVYVATVCVCLCLSDEVKLVVLCILLCVSDEVMLVMVLRGGTRHDSALLSPGILIEV